MYEVEVDVKDFEKLEQDIENLSTMFSSESFKKYIAEKCIKELKTIMEYKLVGISESDMPSNKLDEYKRNNRYKIEGDTITIYNDTMLTQDEMYWVSEKSKTRYPSGISIAYVLEYGTGLVGVEADDWKVNVPSPVKHKDGTWSFKRDSDLFINVRGTSPRLVYSTLVTNIKNKIENWVLDYLEKEWR